MEGISGCTFAGPVCAGDGACAILEISRLRQNLGHLGNPFGKLLNGLRTK